MESKRSIEVLVTIYTNTIVKNGVSTSELRSRVPVPTGSTVPARQEGQAQQAESKHRPKQNRES